VRLGFCSSSLRHQLRNFYMFALDKNWFVPSPGQAVMALEAKKDFSHFFTLRSQLTCQNTWLCVFLERMIVKALGGHCMLPFGCYASMGKKDQLKVQAVICNLQGQTLRYQSVENANCLQVWNQIQSQPRIWPSLFFSSPPQYNPFEELQKKVLRELQKKDSQNIYNTLSLPSPW